MASSQAAEPTGAVTERPRKKRGLGKKILIALLGLVLLLIIAAGILIAVKPWAPDIVVTEAGPTGHRVTDSGMLANYYPATAPGPQPAVVIVGGSEGGLGRQVDRTAQALQREGFSALALSYWGAEGQPQAMDALPVETFDTALEWLRTQPEVDPQKMAFVGTSKGGEAAMLMAARVPELKAVVGYVPSHVVWAGVNLREPWQQMTIGSTWSEGGQQLPYLPYTREFRGGPLVELYTKSLDGLPEHQDAIIPVENSNAELLLVCGEQDQLWPSCPMAREVQQRAEERGGPEVTLLAYPDAGHLISGPPADPGHDFDPSTMGGTVEGGNAALSDSWPKVVDFLKTNVQ
ncbi:MAG: acyl-CoA thioester hydrolase/BAAT C-terminal domain-containing protein [Propionibacteriaceae bacterium]|nr:acyl-CoA thioester hydrolase/BAAT C-terminal domain-containing protein [Propionibacteriaceae bacterium]